MPRVKSAELDALFARIRELTGQGEQQEAPTLAEWAPVWLARYEAARPPKPRTRQERRYALAKHILPRFGDMPLDGIRRRDIEQWTGELLRHLSPKSACVYLGHLSAILRAAERWEVIRRAPHIEMPRVPPPATVAYSEEDCEALVAASTGLARVVVLLGVDAGLRSGEMLGLRWGDIERGVLRIERSVSKGHETATKSGRPRWVPITKRLGVALRRIPDSGEGPLRHLHERALRKLVKCATVAAGVRYCGIHALRHTFASRLARRGASAFEIQVLLGHSDVRTTARYTHPCDESRKRTINLLTKKV